MNPWVIALLVCVSGPVLVFFTCRVFMTVIRIEDVLPRWAAENGLRVIRKEATRKFTTDYRPAYFITVEDQHHRRKNGVVRLGFWYIVGFREKVEVRWDEPESP